jgi:hypothetical protein
MVSFGLNNLTRIGCYPDFTGFLESCLQRDEVISVPKLVKAKSKGQSVDDIQLNL